MPAELMNLTLPQEDKLSNLEQETTKYRVMIEFEKLCIKLMVDGLVVILQAIDTLLDHKEDYKD